MPLGHWTHGPNADFTVRPNDETTLARTGWRQAALRAWNETPAESLEKDVRDSDGDASQPDRHNWVRSRQRRGAEDRAGCRRGVRAGCGCPSRSLATMDESTLARGSPLRRDIRLALRVLSAGAERSFSLHTPKSPVSRHGGCSARTIRAIQPATTPSSACIEASSPTTLAAYSPSCWPDGTATT